ncbi:MAG: arginase family protein, partial [Cypionkella sp.]|nr:arginase family protein [Cypionkella sp.]
MPNTILIGAPIDEGQRRPGCVMGPTAYRVAGLAQAIHELGHGVEDWGDMVLPALQAVSCPNPAVHSLAEVLGWTEVLADKVDDALSQGGLPIVLGG